jgi:UDP-glucose 4-epimerase
MRILVTGGAGFIGSHIADAYLKKGHEVFVIDDLSTGKMKNINPGAKFFEEDIANPKIELYFRKFKFDIINHHAAQINVRKSLDDPLFDARVNIIGSLNIIGLAAKYRAKRIIFASSGGAMYGEPEHFPISESSPVVPMSPYGVAKYATENYIRAFAHLHGFAHVILRYSNVYGPRQISKSEAGVISIFINQALKNRACQVNGNGRQTRDYVYVEDVVRANLLALKCRSGSYNIGTGVETSVNELVDVLSRIMGKKVRRRHRAAIPGEVLRNVLDAKKARKKLGWRPVTPLLIGCKKTFEYFKKIS